MRYVAKEGDEVSAGREEDIATPQPVAPMTLDVERNGGIEDDAESPEPQDQGLSGTLDRLAQSGRSGGVTLVHGSPRRLLAAIDRRIEYSLVVLGDVFLGKSSEVRTRLRSELLGLLTDNLDSPVVDAADLRSELRFGAKELLQLAGFFGAVVVLYALVFTNQEGVLRIVAGGQSTSQKVLGVVAVVILVPVVAFSYGTSVRLIMRGLSALMNARHRRGAKARST